MISLICNKLYRVKPTAIASNKANREAYTGISGLRQPEEQHNVRFEEKDYGDICNDDDLQSKEYAGFRRFL